MIDCKKIIDSLEKLGCNETFRKDMVKCLKEVEKEYASPGYEVRENLTGPIMDALFAGSGVLHKKLSNGMTFEFIYRSKIARDFIMSDMLEPDHVWEPQTTKLLLYLSAASKHVAVGGAYFGDQAILIARNITRSNGICHCFEPNTEQSEMLLRNIKINEINNIAINQEGLWCKPDVKLALVGHDSHAHPELVKNSEINADTKMFLATSLDVYGNKMGIESFDLIMLDIEGGELEALRGAEHYLNQSKDMAPSLVFEVHSDYVDWSRGLENTEILRYLYDRGYTVFSVRDYQSNVSMKDEPIELISPDKTYLDGPSHGFNMLAVKNEDIVKNGCFRLRKNVSPKLLFHRDPEIHQPISGD